MALNGHEILQEGYQVRKWAQPLRLEAAPTITEARVGGSAVVWLSTTSATMQVMLSGPPPRMASSMSWSTSSSRLPTPASALCSVSSLTTLDRPSEHTRYRSPSRASQQGQVRFHVGPAVQRPEQHRPLRAGG